MTPRRGGGPACAEDVEARAARLDITEERVLKECRRIAFSNISHIVGWDDDGNLKPKKLDDLDDEQLAAIAEIVASAGTGKIYRVKLHDKKPVLETLARYLGMLPGARDAAADGEAPPEEEENAREFILHELDRADAKDAAGSGPQPQP